MAFFEDMLKGNLGTALAVGAGAVLAPLLAPALGEILRPAAKAAVKAGVFAYDKGCEAAAQLNELTGGIVAEARAELDQAQSDPESRGARRRRNTGAEA